MKGVWEGTVQWKRGLLVDMFFSGLEALIVLVISSLYLIVLIMKYGLETQGVDLVEALRNTLYSTLRTTDIIIYVTGILSSTTAYFVVRLSVIKTHIKRVIFILLTTAVLFWMATPLFIAGLQGDPVNQTVAVSMASIVGLGAFAIWLFSLFSQRRIFEREFTLSGNRRGEEIAKNVGTT